MVSTGFELFGDAFDCFHDIVLTITVSYSHRHIENPQCVSMTCAERFRGLDQSAASSRPATRWTALTVHSRAVGSTGELDVLRGAFEGQLREVREGIRFESRVELTRPTDSDVLELCVDAQCCVLRVGPLQLSVSARKHGTPRRACRRRRWGRRQRVRMGRCWCFERQR